MLCKAPFVAVYLNETSGKFKPCCQFEEGQYFQSVNDYLKSDFLAEIQKLHRENIWPSGCSKCEKLEVLKNNSDRSYYNRMDFDLENANQYVDWRPSNTCNLKCRICNAYQSSAIQSEQKIEIKERPVDKGDLINERTRVVKLLGGEPFLDKKVVQQMSDLIGRGFAAHLTLKLTTNATILNEKVLELSKSFKKVEIQFSVDATKKTFEYLRSSSEWAQVESNIRVLTSHFEHFRFAPTLGIYNVLTIGDWLPWLFQWENEFKRDEYVVHFTPITDPSYCSLKVLLPEHKSFLLDGLKSLKTGENILADKIVAEVMAIIQGFEFDPVAFNAFVDYNSHLDQIRKTSFSETSYLAKSYTEKRS